jgi:DegV family protein with EDD domain
MRIGLVVDSACDLPKSYIDEHKVIVLPVTIRIEGQNFVDRRDPRETIEFYQSHIGEKGHDAESAPFSVEQIQELFLGRVVIEFDYAICETVTRLRSPIFENATKASFAILRGYKEVRRQHNVEGPFALRVINSRTLFCGQGVLAAETIRMVQEGVHVNEIRSRIEKMSEDVYAYLVPRDLYYIRARAQKKGEKSVGLLGAAIGTMLDIKPIIRAYREETGPVSKARGFEQACEKLLQYAAHRIRAGLLAPTICISYGGDPEEVKQLPGYTELLNEAGQHGVQVLLSVMSVTAGVNIGPGGLCLGLAAAPHEFGD